MVDRPDDVLVGRDRDALLDAAAGLTRQEAEGAFALSLARHDALRPEAVWDIKAQSLRKQNLLSLCRGGDTFTQLGGLETLKEFCRALGAEVGRPVLSLEIGRLMGSLVGESERNVRQALQIAEAMAPSIQFCDKLEKGLAGVNGSGDSGVSTRLFGTLLSWLSHEVLSIARRAAAVFQRCGEQMSKSLQRGRLRPI